MMNKPLLLQSCSVSVILFAPCFCFQVEGKKIEKKMRYSVNYFDFLVRIDLTFSQKHLGSRSQNRRRALEFPFPISPPSFLSLSSTCALQFISFSSQFNQFFLSSTSCIFFFNLNFLKLRDCDA